jgi:hypothetical protein
MAVEEQQNGVPDGWEVVDVSAKPVEKKPQTAGPFDPETAGTGQKLVNMAVDVPVGMVKGAAQAVYDAPGIGTIIGLPPGQTIRQGVANLTGLPVDSPAMHWDDATNDTQRFGKGVDAAIAAGAALSVPVVTRIPYTLPGGGTVNILKDATIGSRVGAPIGSLSMSMIQSIRDEVLGSGPVTMQKVTDAIAKYGMQAAKVALGGKIWGHFIK